MAGIFDSVFTPPRPAARKPGVYDTTMATAPLALKLSDIILRNKRMGNIAPGQALSVTKPALTPSEINGMDFTNLAGETTAENPVTSLSYLGRDAGEAALPASTEGLSAFNLGDETLGGMTKAGQVYGSPEELGALVDAGLPGAAGTGEGGMSLGGFVYGSPEELAAAGSLAPEAAAAEGSLLGTAGSLAGSAVAGGLVGGSVPGLIDALHHDSMENLGHNVTFGLSRSEQTSREIGGGVTGALSGAVAGASYGTSTGPWGAVIGGIVGGIAGLFGAKVKGCIIISACCGEDSHEVEVARRYRDGHMDEEELTGYYTLCIFLVPYIRRHAWFRKIVKRAIVDRLVDHGEVFIGMKGKYRHRTSKAVTGAFLGLCRHVGRGVDAVLDMQEV